MSASKKITMYLYTRYERFWHWLQMALIFVLLVTGFEVHGSFPFLGFNQAVDVHNTVGLAWLIAFAFFIFWVFTTGEWKQYIPTTKKMFQVVLYYSWGIFKGESHPVPKRREAKHNPLQRLIVYLSLAAFLLPVQMLSGFLYWGYNSWNAWGLGWLIAGHHRPGPYGRCVRHPVFHHRPRLHDHHRTHRHRPRQGHDHRLGGC
jgi:thiosulfate reductase cytochrome b subunit